MPGQYDESKHKRDKGKFAHTQGAKGAEKPARKPATAPADKFSPEALRRGPVPDNGAKTAADFDRSWERTTQQLNPKQDKAKPDRGETPQGAHPHIEAAHKASAGALAAVESGNFAQASAHGMALQNSLKGMKAAGVPTEQLTGMRKHLINLSQAIRTQDHVAAHEAAAGFKHEAFKLRHGTLSAAQKGVDAGSPGAPDPTFKSHLDTLKSSGVIDKPTYDKKLGEHVLSRQGEAGKGGLQVGKGSPTLDKQLGDRVDKRERAAPGDSPKQRREQVEYLYKAGLMDKKRYDEHLAELGGEPSRRDKINAGKDELALAEHKGPSDAENAEARKGPGDKDLIGPTDVHDDIERHLQIAREGTSRSPASVKAGLQQASQLLSEHMEDVSDDWGEHPDFNKAGLLLDQADKHISDSKHYSAREALERAHQYVQNLQNGKKRFAAKSWDDAKAQADLIEMSFEEYVQFKAPPAQKA